MGMTGMQNAHHLYRKWLTGFLCMLCITLSPLLHAQQVPAQPKQDWQVTRDHITELRGQARQLRTDADLAFTDSENRCLKKSSSVKCLKKAKTTLSEAKFEAKRLEKEAQDLENEIKAHSRETKKAQKIEREKMFGTAGNKHETEARLKKEKEMLRLANRKPHNPNISNDPPESLEHRQ
jgi:hypothetical protein